VDIFIYSVHFAPRYPTSLGYLATGQLFEDTNSNNNKNYSLQQSLNQKSLHRKLNGRTAVQSWQWRNKTIMLETG